MDVNHVNGIRSELKVQQYYNELGYDIFLPLCGASRADLIYDDGENIVKVQVKTATWSKAGDVNYLQCRLKNRNLYSNMYRDGDFDKIVFVDGDRLWIAPWEEVKGKTSICLDSNREGYSPNSKDYAPSKWLVNTH